MVLVFAMLFSASLTNLLVSKFALDAQFSQLRDKLMIIAQTATVAVDPEILRSIPLTRDGINTAQYKIISDKLMQVKSVNPAIRYIYTMAKTDKEGVWQFIVDPDLFLEAKTKKVISYPGDKYDASRFPEMLKVFEKPSADKELEVDEWGAFLSGYAPIRDKGGKAIAMLGVDMKAEDVYKTQKEVLRRSILVLVFGLILSLGLGFLLSSRITNPVKKLVEGTRRIAQGNLQHQVKVSSHDEIGKLAQSFNKMAQSLYESRRKLHNYFYRIMQSLVRILEARDRYTRGHSERVADYVERIALKLGCSEERLELLKEVAVLHDIGKLGVPESILNKKEKLTDDEWEIVRKHPLIGEDILRPVLLNEEMLVIIRGHHERFDGKGYPDRLTGENINLFAQIISVADAYDAMTSTRAYRPALSKQKAMEELVNNKGTQFDPKVVEVFLKVLEEELQETRGAS